MQLQISKNIQKSLHNTLKLEKPLKKIPKFDLKLVKSYRNSSQNPKKVPKNDFFQLMTLQSLPLV